MRHPFAHLFAGRQIFGRPRKVQQEDAVDFPVVEREGAFKEAPLVVPNDLFGETAHVEQLWVDHVSAGEVVVSLELAVTTKTINPSVLRIEQLQTCMFADGLQIPKHLCLVRAIVPVNNNVVAVKGKLS